MKDYDIALGGVASGNYLFVSGMEIHFSIKNYPPLEHMTDARWVSVLNSFPGFSKIPISSWLFETEITKATIILPVILLYQRQPS